MSEKINRKKVLAEYEKDENDLADDVNTIKEWLITQPHFPEIPSDKMIEHFIVNNKFSLEKTKKKLDMYYTIRARIPSVYNCANPKSYQIKVALDSTYAFNLPKSVDGLYLVTFAKLKSEVPHNLDMNWLIAGSLVNCMEIQFQEDFILGMMAIVDYQHLRMEHIFRMTPMHLKYCAMIFEMLSNRVKGFHLINYPPIVEILLKMCKPIFKQKLLDRVHLHPTIESLTNYIPLDVLPKDYGGKEKCIEDLQEDWNKKLSQYEDRFDKLDTLRVDESLRPTPMENIETFGIQGTFKKLNVD